jgi:uncharacterized coiled-coil protein SlyX
VVSGVETVTLELVGARLLALTADVRDLQQRFAGLETRLGVLETRFSGLETRFSGLETRFSGLEARFAVQEERIARLIALVVRVAERLGTPPE